MRTIPFVGGFNIFFKVYTWNRNVVFEVVRREVTVCIEIGLESRLKNILSVKHKSWKIKVGLH